MLFPLERPEWMAATPCDVLWRRRSVRLLHYLHPDSADDEAASTSKPAKSSAQRNAQTVGSSYPRPLFIVPSMINRHYVCDLMRGRSMVEYLLRRGHDVYLIDWGAPQGEDRLLDFDSCIEDLLGAAYERVLEHAGVEKANVLGYCMGATMAVIYTALYPHKVAGLINLAGPIDFSKAGILGTWTNPSWFNPERITDALGNLPGALMQGSFQWLSPLGALGKMRALRDRIDDEAFVRRFQAIEVWTNDNVDFPGGAYNKYIRHLYQDNRLIKGTYRVRGKAARLDAIHCPILCITATRDQIVPMECAKPLLELSGATDVESAELAGGHVGVVVGSAATRSLFPKLDEWLSARSGAAPSETRADLAAQTPRA
ncbi:MAG: alpha/beta fold hydrolase [Myxococcales bacterium]|nr:alpha/beta fold hydrolase [Myxococcales bacterium]